MPVVSPISHACTTHSTSHDTDTEESAELINIRNKLKVHQTEQIFLSHDIEKSEKHLEDLTDMLEEVRVKLAEQRGAFADHQNTIKQLREDIAALEHKPGAMHPDRLQVHRSEHVAAERLSTAKGKQRQVLQHAHLNMAGPSSSSR